MFLRELEDAGGHYDLATWRYLRAGQLIAQAVEQFVNWRFGRFDNLGSLLEFACGFGRVTRFLACRMPADRIWVSDIYPEAVSFQEQEFGVNSFVSVADPAKIQTGRKYDCILVVSLFSHLPADLFDAWLDRLSEFLCPNGVLVFSVHDSSLLPTDLSLSERGFYFVEQSESLTLPVKQYGTMYVNEAFVRRAARSTRVGEELLRIPRALGSFQDVYILSAAPLSSLPPLQYKYGPIGALESAEIRRKKLRIRGRAADLTEGAAVSVSVSLNGTVVARCRPTIPRPDVLKWTGFKTSLISGFSLTARLPRDYRGADLLVVKANGCAGGDEYLLHIGPLEDAVARFRPPQAKQTGFLAKVVAKAKRFLRLFTR